MVLEVHPEAEADSVLVHGVLQEEAASLEAEAVVSLQEEEVRPEVVDSGDVVELHFRLVTWFSEDLLMRSASGVMAQAVYGYRSWQAK